MYILNFIGEAIKNPLFALFILTASCIVKLYLFKTLIPLGTRSATVRKPWLFLLGILIGSFFGDIAWIVKLIRITIFPNLPYSYVVFWVRISWALVIIQYQSFALFIESFFRNSFTLKLHHKIITVISSMLSLYFFAIAFFDSNLTDVVSRDLARTVSDLTFAPLEIRAMQYAVFYILFPLIIPSSIRMIRHLYRSHLPTLLKHQVKTIIIYLFTPYLIAEAILASQYLSPTLHSYFAPIVAVATIFITYAVAYCIHTVMNLRFLNASPHVQSPYSDNFINNFKTLLDACSRATQKSELIELTKNFFEQTFAINPTSTTLIICSDSSYSNSLESKTTPHHTEILVKEFLSHPDQAHYLKEQKILLYNEIEFSQFYQESPLNNALLTFLQTLNAEMFIPVYQNSTVIAYVIINRQKNALYGTCKRDEIVVFARYLKTILHLIQNRNKDNVYDIKEQLNYELQHKTEEINQYKQNIRSLLRNLKQKDVGLIFYKNKRFIHGNQTAHMLVTVNINTHDAHPITQAVKKITTLAADYNETQKTYVEIDENKKLILIAVPEPDNQEIVIMVYQLENANIAQQLTPHNNVTNIDRAWYLEATQSGALLNQLIPETSEQAITFKINILKVVDSPKGILLTIPNNEITPTVVALQHITARAKIDTITLNKPTTALDIAPLIFGINPIFGIKIEQPPLLETLNGAGMLLLQNAEFLDFEVQQLLSLFIAYGTYTPFKSNKTNTSDVRIVCSVNQDNSKYRLCDDLLAQLVKLPVSLAPYATHNTVQTKTNTATPATTTTYIETRYHPAYSQDDGEIAQIVQLGKAALKDKKSMSILWSYFKDQTTLAAVLGVDRSSINRRCRQYKLM